MQHFIPPKIPAAQPSAQFCADARQIVANPEQYANRPLLRRMAWATLMAERGLRFDPDHIAQMPVEAVQ
jgi:hypothetical protein